MNFDDKELTLLSEEEIWGVNGGRQLDELDKYGTIAAITDLVVLTGGYCKGTPTYIAPDDNSLKGRTSWFSTRSSDGDGHVQCVNAFGSKNWAYCHECYCYERYCAVRPVLLLSPSEFSQITLNRVKGYNGTEEVEYGGYPQYAPDSDMQRRLEREYQKRNLQITGRDYTFNRTKYDDHKQSFQPVKYEEYEYQGKGYIRVQAMPNKFRDKFKLSNGEEYREGDNVWVEVSPVFWLIDDNTKKLICKRGILSGIEFDKKRYNGNFSKTEMKKYLDKHMLRDLTQPATLTRIQMTPEDKVKYEEEIKQVEERERQLSKLYYEHFNFMREREYDKHLTPKQILDIFSSYETEKSYEKEKERKKRKMLWREPKWFR